MPEHISIRPARPADAHIAAFLLYSAYTHTILKYPQPEEEDGFVERLEHFFGDEGNRFSYRNAMVAEVRQQVVGLVLSFGGKEEPDLNAALEKSSSPGERRRLEREAKDDEWYVDAVAVFAQWGRQGIGTQLLQAAEQAASNHHYKKVALNVASENKNAFHLYQKQQYQVIGETILYQQPYLRMVKEL